MHFLKSKFSSYHIKQIKVFVSSFPICKKG